MTLGSGSSPTGLQLSVGGFTGATPFTRTVIVGSTSSVSAPTPQSLGGSVYLVASWSDGGAATHTIVAPPSAAAYTAQCRADNPPVAVASAVPTSGTVPLTVRFDGSGSSDPDPGDAIAYSWDVNGDGVLGDSTAAAPTPRRLHVHEARPADVHRPPAGDRQPRRVGDGVADDEDQLEEAGDSGTRRHAHALSR